MIAFSFLCFLFVNAVSVCYSMDGRVWHYDGREFTIEVKKIGDVHSLTTQDENKILSWLKSKNIDEKTEKFIKKSIFVFIDAQIQEKPEVTDVRDQRYNNYLFRLFDIRKGDAIYKATVHHCKQVALWLKKCGTQRHDNEKERIKIVNHGAYLSLRAKNIQSYKAIVSKTEYRQALLEKNKLIALLSTTEEGNDITSEALSQATLQFHFEPKQKNN